MFQKGQQNNQIKKKLSQIKTIVFNFQQLQAIISFGVSIFFGRITLGETDEKR